MCRKEWEAEFQPSMPDTKRMKVGFCITKQAFMIALGEILKADISPFFYLGTKNMDYADTMI